MNTVLKPCPFCGGEAHMTYSYGDGVYHPYYPDERASNKPKIRYFSVQCCGCGVRTVSSNYIDGARDDWNRRTSE